MVSSRILVEQRSCPQIDGLCGAPSKFSSWNQLRVSKGFVTEFRHEIAGGKNSWNCQKFLKSVEIASKLHKKLKNLRNFTEEISWNQEFPEKISCLWIFRTDAVKKFLDFDPWPQSPIAFTVFKSITKTTIQGEMASNTLWPQEKNLHDILFITAQGFP